MVHQYRNPSVKFIANKDNFNKLLSVLTFQEDNIVSQDWIDKVKNLKDILLRYSKPQRDEDGDFAIIDISLYPKESADLIVLLLSALDALVVDKDYTELIKELLDLVDTGKIAFNPAVELSYLQQDEQYVLLDCINKYEATPSQAQAIHLKN